MHSEFAASVPSPSQALKYDAIVLGAGVSGLVAAKLLLDQGVSHIAVIEEYQHIGGNHLDRHIGPYTFDIGSLIFQDDSPLLDHFPELLALYQPVNIDIGRITPMGRISSYPFSIKGEVLSRGPLEILRVCSSLMAARLFHTRLANARDFARFWMGERLLRQSGLEYYMERFYGVPPKMIDLSFAEKRMGWIADAASLRRRLAKVLMPRGASPKNQQLVRPRSGFNSLYAVARNKLETLGVTFNLGENLINISKSGGNFHVETQNETFVTRRLFGTIPVRSMLSLCGLDDTPELTSVELCSLFFSFEGRRNFSNNILYNFARMGRWKRLTMFSDFYGRANGREYFCVEVNMRFGDTIDRLSEDFMTDSRSHNLFDGDLRIEGHQTLVNAYPVYLSGATEASKTAIARLCDFGIEAFGRQGGFDYLPTARAATMTARDAIAAAHARNKL